MRAGTSGRHRRSTPEARAGVLALAALLVAGAFGIGELVSERGDGKAGADTPAIIRPSADTSTRLDRPRKDPGRHDVTTPDRSPTTEPDPPSATPEVRAFRTSRRDTGRSDERGLSQPRPTATASEEPNAEPAEDPTSDPTDEPTDEPADEPTQGPSDEPTADDDADDLLPPLPGNGSDRSRKAPSPKNERGTAGDRR